MTDEQMSVIPVSNRTRQRLEAFAEGIGGSFDESLEVLIGMFAERRNGSATLAGVGLRAVLARYRAGLPLVPGVKHEPT